MQSIIIMWFNLDFLYLKDYRALLMVKAKTQEALITYIHHFKGVKNIQSNKYTPITQ